MLWNTLGRSTSGDRACGADWTNQLFPTQGQINSIVDAKGFSYLFEGDSFATLLLRSSAPDFLECRLIRNPPFISTLVSEFTAGFRSVEYNGRVRVSRAFGCRSEERNIDDSRAEVRPHRSPSVFVCTISTKLPHQTVPEWSSCGDRDPPTRDNFVNSTSSLYPIGTTGMVESWKVNPPSSLSRFRERSTEWAIRPFPHEYSSEVERISSMGGGGSRGNPYPAQDVTGLAATRYDFQCTTYYECLALT